MEARLLGPVDLPPKNPNDWSLEDRTIYGCPLCYLINHPESRTGSTLSKFVVDDDGEAQVVSSQHDNRILPYHGTTIYTADMPNRSMVSIGVSMGHAYLTEVDEQAFEEQNIVADKITILDEDLPLGNLFFYHGAYYNVYANIVVDVEVEQTLVGLAKEHHKLANARVDDDVYSIARDEYITLLDKYLVPNGVKLDAPYPHRITTMIVSELQLIDSPIPLEHLDSDGAYGVIYRGTVGNEKLIFKYVRKMTASEELMWKMEKENSVMINDNLDQYPNLPYPYTYQSHCCKSIPFWSLDTPLCKQVPPDAGYRSPAAVSIIQYIGSVSNIDKYIAGRIEESPNVIIEALAVLAEAHQGNTVKHHFMHLDAHGGNFLVSRCSAEDRICSLKHDRVVNFGSIEYKFDTYGCRIYLIDFGLSHFIGSSNDGSSNDGSSKYPMELFGRPKNTIGNELLPAIDFIVFFRNVVGLAVGKLFSKLWNDGMTESYEKLVKVYTVLLMVGSSLFTTHVRGMIDNVRGKRNDVIQRLTSSSDDEFPIKLVDEIRTLMEWLVKHNGDYDTLDNLMFITGMYRRIIYQEQLEPISRRVLDYIGDYINVPISDAPSDLSGIPLFLYYSHAAGIDIKINHLY